MLHLIFVKALRWKGQFIFGLFETLLGFNTDQRNYFRLFETLLGYLTQTNAK